VLRRMHAPVLGVALNAAKTQVAPKALS
jgi:hypothetical protein